MASTCVPDANHHCADLLYSRKSHKWSVFVPFTCPCSRHRRTFRAVLAERGCRRRGTMPLQNRGGAVAAVQRCLLQAGVSCTSLRVRWGRQSEWWSNSRRRESARGGQVGYPGWICAAASSSAARPPSLGGGVMDTSLRWMTWHHVGQNRTRQDPCRPKPRSNPLWEVKYPVLKVRGGPVSGFRVEGEMALPIWR